MRKPDLPRALVVIHLQNQTGVGRGMVERFVDYEEIASHLFNASANAAVEQQLHHSPWRNVRHDLTVRSWSRYSVDVLPSNIAFAD